MSLQGNCRLMVLVTVSLFAAERFIPHASCAGSASDPYNLDSIPDLVSLLRRHQAYQVATLMQSSERQPVPVKAVLVTSNDLVGLGNRVPAMVTGFVLALLTKRLFLLQSSIQSFVELPFPADWAQLQHKISGTTCNIPWTRLAEPNLDLCSDAFQKTNGHRQANIWAFSSIDYDLPLLQINPSLKRYFGKFFCNGEVFSAVIQHLLHPKPLIQELMQPYQPHAQQCVVGMHIRTRKYAGVRIRQFTSITRMLMQGANGTVFVASDISLFPYVQQALPEHKVWWSHQTATALQAANKTKASNPGTELSAVLDMLLLAQCKHIILTPASSFGAIAAGYAGIHPVYASFGNHTNPFLNPWFWQSATSEPCFWKASTMHVDTDKLPTKFRNQHPMYLYHNQCHYQPRLRAIPHATKLSSTNISTLLN